MNTSSNNKVYKFAKRGIVRVEYVDNLFRFYGHKPDKEPIDVAAKDMIDLCSYSLTAKEKYDRAQADLAQNPHKETKELASFLISKEGKYETRLEVSTWDGKVWMWLKMLACDGPKRSYLPGIVAWSDLDAQMLKEFYFKCIS